ncbi:MAG: DUF3570 domain-containing protein, partial [Myxococcales bacterium]|nr:DUF3570 domain-containing protein [Myxococcales bacterium]
VSAHYEADVVTAASVAVVDAPTANVDAITSATQLDDVRHTVGGGIDVGGDLSRITLGYAYGFESDYRSHGISLSGRTELFDRNTILEASYGRGFDSVCGLAQPDDREATDRQRLPSSDGCFEAADRESRDLSIQTFQGGITQVWTPVVVTQITLTAQTLNGYQGNPYRGVWLGRSAAEEHHPENRARYAAGIGTRLWIEPLSGALQVDARIYRDTWDIESLTTDVGYEQSIAEGIVFRMRGRFYAQSGAAFYSDDYVFAPKGQYFTGDRELSPMRAWTFGGKFDWEVPAGEDGSVLGFMESFRLILKGDVILSDFVDFHYGAVDVPNTTALVGTLSMNAAF